MEKETHAQAKEETPEKTGKVQVSLSLNDFSVTFLPEFCTSLQSFRISTPRYPQSTFENIQFLLSFFDKRNTL